MVFDFERASKICTKISGVDEYPSTKINSLYLWNKTHGKDSWIIFRLDIFPRLYAGGKTIVVDSPFFSHFPPQRMHQTKLARGKKREQEQTVFKDLRQGNLKLYLNFLKLNWRKKTFFRKSHGSQPEKKSD